MSELINNSERRKELLKHMILQLHEGEAPAQVRPRRRARPAYSSPRAASRPPSFRPSSTPSPST